MATELYRKYRPTMFKEIVGQEEVIQILQKHLKNNTLPHAILFTGPSGTGKTTTARILASKLKCTVLTEMDNAQCRGIDDVRSIKHHMRLAGGPRIWLLDEAHKLSTDAQNAMLNVLEEPPPHVYLFLCSSEPEKLIKAIRTRCTPIGCRLLKDEEMETLILSILKKEKAKLGSDVLQKLIQHSEGSPRQGLVLLENVLQVESEEDQLNVILSSSAKENAFKIFRLLIDGRSRWPDVAKILKNMDDEPEKVRHMVLSAASTTILGGNGRTLARAYKILSKFQFDWYASKKAGLILACYEVIMEK